MKFLLQALLAFVGLLPALAEEKQFSSVVKSALVFRAESDPTNHYPHVLRVFLRLDNVSDGEVTWVANNVTGIEAELFDADGKAVPSPPGASSIQSNPRPLNLPYGSRLDWLITHGGRSMMGDTSNHYVLVIGGRGWLVPMDKVGLYSLRIRLRGHPWTSTLVRERLGESKLLLDLRPAKLVIAADD